jgi:hypothetical protein
MACAHPVDTKESLINHFEEIRLTILNEKNLSRSTRVKLNREDKKFYDFILCFFRVQAIMYTNIGIDDIEVLYTQQQTLLSEYFASID